MELYQKAPFHNMSAPECFYQEVTDQSIKGKKVLGRIQFIPLLKSGSLLPGGISYEKISHYYFFAIV